MQEINQLNEKFYELYGRLYENSELLTKKQTDFIAEKLFEQYKKEYELISLRKSIPDKQELFELKARRDELVPWSFLFFKNKPAKLTQKEVSLELKAYFKARADAIKAVERGEEWEEPEEGEKPAQEAQDGVDEGEETEQNSPTSDYAEDEAGAEVEKE